MNSPPFDGQNPGPEWPPPPPAAAGGGAGYGGPADGVIPPGYPAPPPPLPPAARPGRKAAPIAMAGAAIAILAGVLMFAVIKHANSTSSVRVIIPAPAAAGGLNRDYADEQNSEFQTALSALHQRFVAAAHGGTFGAAIYTNAAAGSSATNASLVVIYLGFNAPSNGDPAGALKSALSGVGARLTQARMLQEGGGRGDTQFACETGNSLGRRVVVCGWATDRTVGLVVPQTPTDPTTLAAVVKEMEPNLVRG